MTGRLSIEKAKQIREKRELEQEMRECRCCSAFFCSEAFSSSGDVMEFEQARGARAKRSDAKPSGMAKNIEVASDDNESEVDPVAARRKVKRSVTASNHLTVISCAVQQQHHGHCRPQR